MTGDKRGAGRVALIGLPFDANSSHLRGPAEAPWAIRAALRSDSTNLWTESGVDLGAPGVITDAGDVAVSNQTGHADFAAMEAAVARCLERGLRPLVLGGDHSVTLPVVRAVAGKHGPLNILHFDAHPDLYDEFQGNRFSHACPFARISEEKLATRLVQVGIRTMNGQQLAQARLWGVELVEMRRLHNAPRLRFDGPVHISFDLDALDPAFAPGVSHHEPGGMSTREALALIQSLDAPVVSADIVEFNPSRDPLGITAMAAAKILKELAARMLR